MKKRPHTCSLIARTPEFQKEWSAESSESRRATFPLKKKIVSSISYQSIARNNTNKLPCICAVNSILNNALLRLSLHVTLMTTRELGTAVVSILTLNRYVGEPNHSFIFFSHHPFTSAWGRLLSSSSHSWIIKSPSCLKHSLQPGV